MATQFPAQQHLPRCLLRRLPAIARLPSADGRAANTLLPRASRRQPRRRPAPSHSSCGRSRLDSACDRSRLDFADSRWARVPGAPQTDVALRASAMTLVEASRRKSRRLRSVSTELAPRLFRLRSRFLPRSLREPVSVTPLMTPAAATGRSARVTKIRLARRSQASLRPAHWRGQRLGMPRIDCHRAKARCSSGNAGRHFDAAWEPNHQDRRLVPRLVAFRATSDLATARGRSIRKSAKASTDRIHSLCNAQWFSRVFRGNDCAKHVCSFSSELEGHNRRTRKKF